MKKSLAFMFVALTGMTTCVRTDSLGERSKIENPKRKFVSTLEEKTVAIVKTPSSGGSLQPKCSGVWVSRKEILTAAHCIVGKFDNLNQIEFVILADEKKEKSRLAKTIALDTLQDLALLEVESPPRHPIASLSDEAWDGQHVNIVGHTNGLWWSFMEGIISSSRIDANDMTKYLQISSPAWKGNSGGGAFDDDGKLVGICSFVIVDSPMVSFFVHVEKLKEFLESNRHP